MRVLHWSDSFWPAIGGVETFVGRLAEAQRSRGDEVLVVCNQWDDMPSAGAYRGVDIARFPFAAALAQYRTEAISGIVRKLRELKQRFRPEIVHVHALGSAVWFHLLTDLPHVPMLVTIHWSSRKTALPAGLLQRVIGGAQRVVAVSAAALEEIRSQFPDCSDRSVTIWNGIGDSAVAPTLPPAEADVMLCIARLSEEKGIDIALRAFALIAAARPRARMIVVGDGPDRVALEALAQELGCGSRVEFRGAIPQEGVPAIINEATLVVIPSRGAEPFGLVAIEAAQMGRPVVASGRGGLNEVVRHRETGLLVEPENSRVLADAIAGLLDDPAEMRRMGAAARVDVQRRFGLIECAERYEGEYRGMLRTRAPAGRRLGQPAL